MDEWGSRKVSQSAWEMGGGLEGKRWGERSRIQAGTRGGGKGAGGVGGRGKVRGMDESAGGGIVGAAGMLAETTSWRRLSCATTSVRETEGDEIVALGASVGEG